MPLRWHVKRKSLTPETIKWGLSSIAVCQARGLELCRKLTSSQRTVKFINDEASSIHGNVRVGSVYTSESGEWKMSGFEVLSNVKEDDAVIYVRKLFSLFYADGGADCSHRRTEVWSQTLQDMLHQSLPAAAGMPSRRTLTQPLTLSVSVA